ncbi:MAG: serine/threonine-protein kinase [Polyangiaceae bacterium]
MGAPRIGPTDPHADTLAEASTIADHGSVRAENVFTVAPGTLLGGKYRVVRTLGRGGMGIVVEAFHLELQVPVAIKLLLPELMPYAEAAIRFQREARAVSKLTSPHVARVIDVDTLPSGEPYIVMELLKGKDLAERGRDPIPLSVAEAIDYVVQACDAIAEAHAMGIVHRDLKPANLFVARKGSGGAIVKVLDFGVSKVLSGDTGEVSLTHTTTILGSALYMSPEQMRSARDVDHRTDVYALGACLYELLARRPPYLANSFPELCAMVYSGPPMSLTEWSPDAPEGLAKVVEKALAHEPGARFATVAELTCALAPYADERTRARIDAILAQHAPHLELPKVARRRRSLEPVQRGADEPAKEGRMTRGQRVVVGLLLAVGVVGIGAAVRTKLPWPELRGVLAVEAEPAAGQPGREAAAGSSEALASGADGARGSRGEGGRGAESGSTESPASAASAEAGDSGDAAQGSGDDAASAAAASALTASASTASAAAGASTAGASTASAAAGASTAGASTASAPTAGASTASAPTAGASTGSTAGARVGAKPAGNEGTGDGTGSRTAPGSAPSEGKKEAPSEAPPASPGQPVVNPGLDDRTCYAILPDGTRNQVPCP